MDNEENYADKGLYDLSELKQKWQLEARLDELERFNYAGASQWEIEERIKELEAE